MKKFTITLSLLSVMLLTSCKNNEPVKPATPPATPPPVENPAPPKAPAPRVSAVTPAPAPKPAPVVNRTTTETTTTEKKDGTTVSISSKGVDIKSKNGKNENNITLSGKKQSSIEIKTN